MQTPPPTYATLFPNEASSDPPPPYVGATVPVPTWPAADGPATLMSAASSDTILQRLFSLQCEINCIKDLLNDRAAHSASLGICRPTQPSAAAALAPPSSALIGNHHHHHQVASGDAKTGELRHTLMSPHQEQATAIGETLCRLISSLQGNPANTVKQNEGEHVQAVNEVRDVQKKETMEDNKKNSNDGNEKVYQDVCVGSLTESTVDLVHLLTTMYSLPMASCECCHENLPSSFGEEVIAAALNMTRRDLLDQYASMLVIRLNERYAASKCRPEDYSSKIIFLTKGGDLAHRVLAPLPLHVVHWVLERTEFPSEIPAYKIAFSSCEVYHQRHLVKMFFSSRPISFTEPSTAVASSSLLCTSRCQCKEEAEVLLQGIRFLWLPLFFLEDELSRCEALGLTPEGCNCSIYAGLLLRLRQAVRVKRGLRDLSTTPMHNLPPAFAAEPFLAELHRLRPSYEFLTVAEREQLLSGKRMNFFQLRQLQERCDAT